MKLNQVHKKEVELPEQEVVDRNCHRDCIIIYF